MKKLAAVALFLLAALPAFAQTATPGPGLSGDAHWRAPAASLPSSGNHVGDVRLSAAALWYWNGSTWTQLGGSGGGGGGGAPSGPAGGELGGTYPDPYLLLPAGAPSSAAATCAIGRAWIDTTSRDERACFCTAANTWRCQTLSRQLFEPRQISGLALWLRGDSLIALGTDDAAIVQHWPDSSGNGFGAVQVAGSESPLFVARGGNASGVSAVSFDGSLQHLVGVTNSKIITAAAFTVFAVFNVTAVQTSAPAPSVFGNEAVWSDQSGYVGMHLSNTGPTIYAYNFSGAVATVAHSLTLSSWTLAEMRHGGGQLCLAVGTDPESCTSSGDTDVINDSTQIGQGSSSARITGKIAELIVYNRSLTSQEIAQVAGYLRARHGI